MTQPTDLIQLGFIRGAHALKGQVIVHVFSGQPESLTAYGPLFNADGSKSYNFTVTGAKTGADFLCKLEGVNDRNQAEEMRGTRLFVPASALPETDEDEFYIKDLMNLTALGTNGAELGKVLNVTTIGSHDALEVEFHHDGTNPLPAPRVEYILFTKQAVPDLNLTAGTVTIDLPEDLFGEAKPEAE